MTTSPEPTVTRYMVLNPKAEHARLSNAIETDSTTKKMTPAKVSTLSHSVAHNGSCRVMVGNVRDIKQGTPIVTAAGVETLNKAPTPDELAEIHSKGFICIEVQLISIPKVEILT
jgi:hypothetical protein